MIDEVDGAEAAVPLHLTDDAPDAVAVVGVVLAVEGHAVVADGKQLSALADIPAHTLVHDGDEVVGLLLAPGLLESLRHLHLGEEYLWRAPLVAVARGLQHGVRGWDMLVAGVAEVMDVELVVPIGHHRLVVIGPALSVGLGGMLAVGAQYLDVVHTHHGRQSAVVAVGVAERRARIVNLLGVQQPLEDGFVGLKDGAVLVQTGHADLVADILESLEVLGEVGSEVLQLIAVVVDEPAAFLGLVNLARHLHRRGSFHHLSRERLRGLAPRAVGRRGVGHLDVALRTGVVFEHHDIIFVAPLHQRSVDAREARLYHELGRGEVLEVLGGGIVQTVVVLVLFLSVGKLARDAGGPDDDSLLADIVPEQLGCPDVDGGGVGHHLDEALLAPVHQVFRTGIAEAAVAPPAGRPHQMEHAVGGADDGGVAHHALLAHLRLQPDAVDRLPLPTVATVDETQSVGGRLVERGGDIHLLLSPEASSHGEQRNGRQKVSFHAE